MIPLDGYTEEHSIDGVAILLRPFTRFERPLIGQFLSEMGDVMANRTERRLVLSRVVDCEGDIEDLYGEQLWELAMGVYNTEWEIADEDNLHSGVYCLTRWPWFARTSCEQCRTWLWNPLNGRLHRNAGEPPLKRQGATLCESLSWEWGDLSGTACPRGYWARPNDLSAKNQLAWKHYQACEAAGLFPDDPIVRRNVRLIRNAQRHALADQQADGRSAGGSWPTGQLRHAQTGRVRADSRSSA